MSHTKSRPDDADPWPIRLMQQRYVDGELSLAEFEAHLEYHLETGRVPADVVGYIP